jgi:hypothetical protein
MQQAVFMSAQEDNQPAVVTVFVTDHSGVVIANAEVSISSTSTTEQKSLTNSPDGRYTLTATPGGYGMKVNSRFFLEQTRKIQLYPGTQTIAIEMQLSQTTETVQICGPCLPVKMEFTHGLILKLGHSDENIDTAAIKSCLENHPPIACVPFVLTIKNEGKEIVERLTTSCGMAGQPAAFEIQHQDGSWHPFPINNYEIFPCTRNMIGWQEILPGHSYPVTWWLGHENSQLDTEYPSRKVRDRLSFDSHIGYKILHGAGMITIRAQLSLQGCVASENIQASKFIQSLDSTAHCAGGAPPAVNFVVLQSNPMDIAAPSTQH